MASAGTSGQPAPGAAISPGAASSSGAATSPGAASVVVVGAGFAGLSSLRVLAHAGLRVTLVDHNIYSTFQPLLYQVATAGLNPGDVAYPARGFTRKYGVRFRRGELKTMDTQARRVTLADGSQLGYDYLIIATGVSASYFGIEGAAKNSLALYTRSDAIKLRDHLMAGLERLSVAETGEDVVITIVGGGATGVEVAGTLAELRNVALAAAYPEIAPARVKVRLVELGPALIAPFSAPLCEYARRQLVKRGVDIQLDTTIREVTPHSVIVDSGEELRSDITVWAAGVAATPSAADWGLPQGKHGRIVVGPDLRVKGQDRIFAIGDIGVAEVDPSPQLAQPAIQEGKHAARQIRNLAAGQPTTPFRYHDKGLMATIGRRSAVVDLPQGIRIRGTLAWLAWLALHIFYLLGNRNRISTLLNLSWRYLTWRHGGGMIVGDDPPVDGE
ncbi:MAG TPA: NAD(P)/FAD-dependent oxidoreductase [Streptosporangiaceae bacterium]